MAGGAVVELLPAATAFWLGALTSISPCPLATNIAAISFVGRGIQSPRRVILSGVVYTLGRVLAYGVLGAILTASLLSVPVVSQVLQKYLNQVLGPLLIVVGMFLVELLSFGGTGSGWVERFGQRFGQRGYVGAGLLGMLFALSFCPISAALFFGSLVPLAVANDSGAVLSSVYGVGTGLPVLAMALLMALGGKSLGQAFKKLTSLETWVRRITGAVFIVVGVYLTLVYVFNVVG